MYLVTYYIPCHGQNFISREREQKEGGEEEKDETEKRDISSWIGHLFFATIIFAE